MLIDIGPLIVDKILIEAAKAFRRIPTAIAFSIAPSVLNADITIRTAPRAAVTATISARTLPLTLMLPLIVDRILIDAAKANRRVAKPTALDRAFSILSSLMAQITPAIATTTLVRRRTVVRTFPNLTFWRPSQALIMAANTSPIALTAITPCAHFAVSIMPRAITHAVIATITTAIAAIDFSAPIRAFFFIPLQAFMIAANMRPRIPTAITPLPNCLISTYPQRIDTAIKAAMPIERAATVAPILIAFLPPYRLTAVTNAAIIPPKIPIAAAPAANSSGFSFAANLEMPTIRPILKVIAKIDAATPISLAAFEDMTLMIAPKRRPRTVTATRPWSISFRSIEPKSFTAAAMRSKETPNDLNIVPMDLALLTGILLLIATRAMIRSVIAAIASLPWLTCASFIVPTMAKAADISNSATPSLVNIDPACARALPSPPFLVILRMSAIIAVIASIKFPSASTA